MTRVVKPQESTLLKIANGECPLPYQFVNWWAFWAGSNLLIRDVYDTSNPLYIYAWMHQGEILEALAKAIGCDLTDTAYGRACVAAGSSHE